ncbi:alpha-L-fucosidase, partial [candidate division KSB1 bacterium]
RTTAQIPIDVYDKFIEKFNPVKFDAKEWVKMAKDAGMKYIVITSKHHDGFCLFDSKYTDFDVMSTPFKRDILKELSDACRKEGIKMCWYHSIMDWHHPDYLPRRGWETDRSTEGADLDRYIEHMKNQLRELVKNYGGIGVLWFDGEWENTWTHEYGKDLYNYVRSMQPDIIINNRVDVGRSGMQGLTKEGEYTGDFGTPEQEIPPTGLPGVDWETCMTMNNHWGYNKNDNNWKSSEDLIRKLADIASKGGNFLLNVGPTSEGLFPQPSIDRLRNMGTWMKVNGESIYGTKASPFKELDWGRCTQKEIEGGTRLYLHVFEWPENGKLVVPGIFNNAKKAYLLSDKNMKSLQVNRNEDALVISVPDKAPDLINAVIVLDIAGKTDINDPPRITAEQNIFIEKIDITVKSGRENIQIRYTLDGSIPGVSSPLIKGPVTITKTTTMSARCFRDGKPVSGSVKAVFTKVKPEPAAKVNNVKTGLKTRAYKGDWDILPDFDNLTPVLTGEVLYFDISAKKGDEHYGFVFEGLIKVGKDGVYSFFTDSDDGSRLYIGDKLLVDNDGLHGMQEEEGVIALAKGLHTIKVTFFEKTGGDDLKVYYKGAGIEKQEIPGKVLFHKE